MLDQAYRAHRFLADHAFYTLTLSSAFASLVFVGRVYLSRSQAYSFLLWNLSLAWIPYWNSLFVTALWRRDLLRWWLFLPASLAWLLFFPNAPYLVTDLIHLQYHTGFAGWYDVGMLALFAWTGLSLAVVSLTLMKACVQDRFGSVSGGLFLLGMTVLSGFGIYLGRFQHWNSWDLVFNPYQLLRDVVGLLSDPLSRYRVVGVTGLYAGLLWVCYLSLSALIARQGRLVRE